MDRDCRDCAWGGRRLHSDLPDCFAVYQSRLMSGLANYTDEDFRRTIWSALKLVAIAVAVGIPLLWWKAGGETALLFVVGALISGSSLFEWLRLMTALMGRMDVQT